MAGNMRGTKGRWFEDDRDRLLGIGEDKIDVAILESFYYADEWTERIIPKTKRFLLDSGAFTFFSSGKSVDWNDI